MSPRYVHRGGNDHHVAFDGKLRSGLEPTLQELHQEHDALTDRIQTILNEVPMLKGTGFIVIDPSNPRFDGEEHADVEEAKIRGSDIAYKSGTAIVYMPVVVMRPRRETADVTPSKLFQQIGMPALSSGAPEGKPVTTVDPT